MRYFFLLLTGMFIIQFSFAQDWKKDAKTFGIKQDDDKELVNLWVPAKSEINETLNYALYTVGKSTLMLDYELDDDPGVTVPKTVKNDDVDLIAYAKAVPDYILTGNTDFSISNKKAATSVQKINGYQTLMLSYDYVHTISGQEIKETGKVIMYLVKVKGTSLVDSDEHPILIRIRFDLQQNGGENMEKMALEIMRTIKKAE